MDLDEFLCADANTDEDEYEDVEDDVDSDFGYGGRSEGTYDLILSLEKAIWKNYVLYVKVL